jgi:hypothetical protein
MSLMHFVALNRWRTINSTPGENDDKWEGHKELI